MQCKAAVLEDAPGKLVVDDIELDSPAAEEILIRTAAAGVCHSDLHFMQGKFPHALPAVLGHESAGVVEEVGSAVRGIRPGDHVITCLSVFCGRCDFCMVGSPHLCRKEDVDRPAGGKQRMTRGGEPVHQFLNTSSFAEYMLVHENAAVRVRPDMPLDKAALIGCGVTTGVGAVFNTAGVRPGETVAVAGCGGIGLAAVQGAKIAGAGRIIAIDKVAGKLDMARRMGATDVVDVSAADPVEAVVELTSGGVHHSFEAIGLASAAQQCFEMLRPGGTATVIGMVPAGQRIELDGYTLLRERKIQGSTMGSNRFRVDMPRYVDMYLSGRLELDALVSATAPLSEINECYEVLEEGEVARQIITF